jgi:hypothetical protein
MQYWQMRLTLYRESIREMRETIQQLGMAVAVLFQVAIPAVFFFFLVGLGQLAEPDQSIETYLVWLSGYGVLMYGLIRFQRKAILASSVRFWDSSLPATELQRSLAVIGLCSVAGNIFLVLPIGLMLYLMLSRITEVFSSNGFEQLWPIMLTCIWGIQSTVLALYRRYFPLLVLVVLPAGVWLTSFYSAELYGLTILLLGPVLTLFIAERPFEKQIKLSAFWQLLLVYQLNSWQSFLLKVTGIILCCLFFAKMRAHTPGDIEHWVVLCCIFLSASLASTIQFSLLEFQQRYRYFLAALPIPPSQYRRHIVLFIGGFGLSFLLVTGTFVGFSVEPLVFWIMFYTVGIWSVKRYKKRFFIPLIILFVLFAFMYSYDFITP